ncbi:MAG: OmpH family outer membrane protein [Syntrophobacteraceae bacterium]
MRKLFGLVALATGIVFGFSANAVAASGSVKIGYVDINGAAAQSAWGKKVIDQLNREKERLSGDLDQKGKAYKAAREEYEKKKDVMDEKAKSRKQKEIQDMAVELERLATDASQRFNKDASDARAPLFQKIQDIVKKIGRDDKYDFILERGSLPFANEKDDLTKRVASELDKSAPR